MRADHGIGQQKPRSEGSHTCRTTSRRAASAFVRTGGRLDDPLPGAPSLARSHPGTGPCVQPAPPSYLRPTNLPETVQSSRRSHTSPPGTGASTRRRSRAIRSSLAPTTRQPRRTHPDSVAASRRGQRPLQSLKLAARACQARSMSATPGRGSSSRPLSTSRSATARSLVLRCWLTRTSIMKACSPVTL